MKLSLFDPDILNRYFNIVSKYFFGGPMGIFLGWIWISIMLLLKRFLSVPLAEEMNNIIRSWILRYSNESRSIIDLITLRLIYSIYNAYLTLVLVAMLAFNSANSTTTSSFSRCNP